MFIILIRYSFTVCNTIALQIIRIKKESDLCGIRLWSCHNGIFRFFGSKQCLPELLCTDWLLQCCADFDTGWITRGPEDELYKSKNRCTDFLTWDPYVIKFNHSSFGIKIIFHIVDYIETSTSKSFYDRKPPFFTFISNSRVYKSSMI